MGARASLTRLVSAAAAATGLYHVAGAVYGGLGVVLSLHRVVEPGRPMLWPGYEIPADVLDALLGETRRLGWEAVTLDEAQRRVVAGRTGRRFVCFTLDDGYADNLSLGLPVFRRHGVPFCVYVTTGLVERTIFYWWGALDALVRAHDRIVWDDAAGPLVLTARTWAEKAAAYDALNDRCYRAAPESIRALLRAHGVDWEALLDREALTREQARVLAEDPLVTIGAHGITHEKLSAMREGDASREIGESRAIIEGWIGREVRHLAYPFGAPSACGPREFELARRAGYRTAVTTRRGNLFPEHRDHLTSLPRREVPLNLPALRNALFGVETVLRRSARLQTA